MKKRIKIFAFPLFILLGICLFFKPGRMLKRAPAKAVAEVTYPVTEQKPFVVVIASYNNELLYEKNLQSVFEQKYDNYRVIYIDDASTDRTCEKVQSYVTAQGKDPQVTLIHNEKNRGPTENYYRAVHSCQDSEIAVILDGDDWFAADSVLQKLNEVYANPNIWMTYGSYFYYPSLQLGECSQKIPPKILEENSIRTYTKKGFITSHLKTFYAGLFKKIRLQDLVYEDAFLPASWDVASMIPMLEMSGQHAKFIREVLYVNNRANPLNEDKVKGSLQQECDQNVRSSAKYARLSSLDLTDRAAKKSDLIIFSYDRPLQLYACLESVFAYMSHLGQVTVIARASSPQYLAGYEKIKQVFGQVEFVFQSSEPHKDFKPLALKAIYGSSTPYIAFAVDDIIVKDSIDIFSCTKAMEETGAWGFYLRLGKNIERCYMDDKTSGVPSLISWKEGEIYAWQFKQGRGDWNYSNNLDMTIFEKQKIKKELEKVTFTNPNSMESAWQQRAKGKRVGLCFSSSKMVNIPLNLVNISSNRHLHSYGVQELLQKFDEGLKMDIAPLHFVTHNAPHIEYEPTFVPRKTDESFALRPLDE